MRQKTAPTHRREVEADLAEELRRAEREVRLLRSEVAKLRRALRTRPMIGMVLGAVMATEDCSLEQAWHVLERASLRTRLTLHALAQTDVRGAGAARPPAPMRVAALGALRPGVAAALPPDPRPPLSRTGTDPAHSGYPADGFTGARPRPDSAPAPTEDCSR
ncbi:ANTAR domain-containing protein [Streptomyces sp. NPDC058417]|uniref:ANTAR domain-containing protein n=1 Tax=unclassified Streptomyces TaxID=2593676 RepID=UPI0036508740